MDIRMIVKILAVLAIVALSYRMWGARRPGRLSIPRPYEGFGDDDYEEDYEEDDYEEDDYEEDYEEDYEDDMEDDDYEMHSRADVYHDMEDDMSDDDMSDDMEDDMDDYSEDMEDDMEDDYEHHDMEDDDDYEDDMEDDDYEMSGMSRLTKPTMPLMSPSSKLLPRPSIQAQDFAKYAPKELGAQNFLTATQWIGVNTQGSSLRNANYDIRANPVISKKDVGPWGQSTIDPDVYTKPLF